MCGGGSGATFWAFAIPLGSTTWLCAAPMMPAFGRTPPKFPAAPRANEAVVEARITKTTEATFTVVFDMMFDMGKLPWNSLECG
jgi:hypothetical protein